MSELGHHTGRGRGARGRGTTRGATEATRASARRPAGNGAARGAPRASRRGSCAGTTRFSGDAQVLFQRADLPRGGTRVLRSLTCSPTASAGRRGTVARGAKPCGAGRAQGHNQWLHRVLGCLRARERHNPRGSWRSEPVRGEGESPRASGAAAPTPRSAINVVIRWKVTQAETANTELFLSERGGVGGA